MKFGKMVRALCEAEANNPAMKEFIEPLADLGDKVSKLPQAPVSDVARKAPAGRDQELADLAGGSGFDAVLLADHFVRKHGTELGREGASISTPALPETLLPSESRRLPNLQWMIILSRPGFHNLG